MIDLESVFQKYIDADEYASDEYLKFSLIGNDERLSPRPDIHAFLLLDKILPASNENMISWSGHDNIVLVIDCEKLAEVATEENIRDLIRCGVRYEDDALCMFV